MNKFKELESILRISDLNERFKGFSILNFGEICDCNNGFLCKHRRKWLIRYIKNNFNEKYS